MEKKHYQLPEGMRYSTLEERRIFYESEFDLGKVAKWIDGWKGKLIFAVIMGRHTGIFLEKYREDASTTILIDEYENLEDLRSQILEFLPEAVYYDRNLYGEDGEVFGQELAFDLDPENFVCPIHGSLEDKMKRHQGLSFCEIELKMVKEETEKLYEELEKEFSDLRIVYSGRGFHIHVWDEEAFSWDRNRREAFAKRLKEEGYRIDSWVPSGGMRLIRLPYSLHGMVSRIVLPLKKEELADFNPIEDERCIPRFLKADLSGTLPS